MVKCVFILLLLPVGCFCIGRGTTSSIYLYTVSQRDPCQQFTELKNISYRSPYFKGDPVVNDDFNLASDWYAAPAGWVLLDRDPGRWKRCGTEKPIYRTGKGKGRSTMCVRSETAPCQDTFSIETETCGIREVYKLLTHIASSGFCFLCVGRKLDILIISDVSRSIGSPTFQKMKQFQRSLLSRIHIAPAAHAVALMEFAETPRFLLTLDSASSKKKSDVLLAISNQLYDNGPSTDLANALHMAESEVFTTQTGDRADAENMVILFTDGWLYKSEQEDVAAVIRPLSAKAELFVVASKGENSVVREIASKPKDDHIFHLNGKSDVEKIRQKIEPCPTRK